jgi:hypothetical protein
MAALVGQTDFFYPKPDQKTEKLCACESIDAPAETDGRVAEANRDQNEKLSEVLMMLLV